MIVSLKFYSGKVIQSETTNITSIFEAEEGEAAKDHIHETRPWYRVSHLVKHRFYFYSFYSEPTGNMLGALSSRPTFGWIIVFLFAQYLRDKSGGSAVAIIGDTITIIEAMSQCALSDYGIYFGSIFAIESQFSRYCKSNVDL